MQWGSEPFTDRSGQAYAEGKLPKQRLSDMVRPSRSHGPLTPTSFGARSTEGTSALASMH